MEDLAYLDKLKEHETKILKENENAQANRRKIRDEYRKLMERLKTLPDTTTQPTMVPIGDVGFFPGKLIHTNEIMVLLGDDWFAERSAKQASEIAQRRIQMIDIQLKDFEKEYESIKAHLGFTDHFQELKSEHNGVMEIKEELPPNYETQNKEGKIRKAHVPKHNLTQRTVTFQTTDDVVHDLCEDIKNSNSNEATINHDELFARLNQLEKEEQEEEEREHNEQIEKILRGTYQNKNGENQVNKTNVSECSNYIKEKEKLNGPINGQSDHTSRRHVQFESDLQANQIASFDSDDEELCDNVIKFRHSTNQLQRCRSASESEINIKQKVNSPADIFEHFTSSKHVVDVDERPLKSILKKDSRSNSNENLKLKPILKTSPEHRPGTPEYVLDEPRPILKTPPDTQGSDRRPGTPEYMLNDEPKPILKTYDNLDSKHRNTEVHFSDSDCYIDYTEETRGILKSYNEPRAIEDSKKGIRKQDQLRTILKSPESWKPAKSNEVSVELRPILKHQNDSEAFSGNIVERDTTNPTESLVKREEEKKPVSRFKASRLKK